MAVDGKFWLGTSWKMNKTISEAEHWVRAVFEDRQARPALQQFVIPPFTATAPVAAMLRGTSVLVGAQDVHPAGEGAHTGDVSARMVAEAGAVIAELGHQERRRDHGETDDVINAKVRTAASYGLRPLLCVGDTMQDRNWGTTGETLARQLKAGFFDLPDDARRGALVAYEPAWAIGVNGVAASAEQIRDAHSLLRGTLADLWGADAAAGVALLYGGNVSRDNAAEIAALADVDGLFVGRAALDPAGFVAIRSAVLTSISLQGES
jgi:triosephosphate isomerase